MLSYTFINQLSLLKHRFYCNGDKYVFCAETTAEINDLSPRIETVCEAIRDLDDFSRYADCRELKQEFYKFKYFLQQGCQLYLVFQQNNLAAYACAANLDRFHPYPFARHPVFQGGTSYLVFYGRTFPEYRCLGINSYILTRICRDNVKNGARVFVTTDRDNLISQKTIRKAGLRKLGVLKYLKIGCFVLRSSFKAENHDDRLLNISGNSV